MDMAADETDDPAVVEDRLPQMQVRRMGREIAAIGIVGESDITRFIALYHRDGAAIADAGVPGGSEVHGHRDGRALRVGEHHREILRLLDEGGQGGAIERVGHVLSRRSAMVGKDLQSHLVDGHLLTPPFRDAG